MTTSAILVAMTLLASWLNNHCKEEEKNSKENYQRLKEKVQTFSVENVRARAESGPINLGEPTIYKVDIESGNKWKRQIRKDYIKSFIYYYFHKYFCFVFAIVLIILGYVYGNW